MKKLIMIIIYSSIYMMVHVNYLSEVFGYLGYMSYEHNIIVYIITYIYIIFPLILKYTKNQSLSFFFNISYLLLYIPLIITQMYQNEKDDVVYYRQLIYSVSFFLIFLIPKLYNKEYVFQITADKNKNKNFKFYFYWCIISSLLLLVIYRNQISFVSFEDVYEHRSSHEVSFPFIGYIILWNVYLFGPLTIIKSLKEKNLMGIVIGFSTIIIVYGINASKIVLFIPILIIVSYFIIKYKKDIFTYFTIGFSFLMLLFYNISQYYFLLAAVILMRTFGIAGLLTTQYEEFFQKNPNTYYSHINFVNKFIYKYPYDNVELGRVVSRYFDSQTDSNSNANFWATDGIASLDDIGVIIISIVLGFFLLFWKKMINQNNFTELILMLIPFSFIILNVGFFTSILSGGYIFFLLYYFYIKKIYGR